MFDKFVKNYSLYCAMTIFFDVFSRPFPIFNEVFFIRYFTKTEFFSHCHTF